MLLKRQELLLGPQTFVSSHPRHLPRDHLTEPRSQLPPYATFLIFRIILLHISQTQLSGNRLRNLTLCPSRVHHHVSVGNKPDGASTSISITTPIQPDVHQPFADKPYAMRFDCTQCNAYLVCFTPVHHLTLATTRVICATSRVRPRWSI